MSNFRAFANSSNRATKCNLLAKATNYNDLMKQFCLFGFSIFLLYGCTYNLDNREKYREDVRYFFQTLRELHPAPYARISKDSFNILEQKILEECGKMESVRDLNVALLSCNQYFDGHTYCSILPSLYVLMPTFKWSLEVRNDSVFWQPTGDHVVTLDTFESSGYLARVRNFISYDLALKNKNAEYIKSSFFYLLNGFKSPRYVDLYNTETRKIYRQVLDNQMKFTFDSDTCSAAYRFKYFPDDSIAVFEYNTSDIKKFEQFQDTLQFFFNKIEELSVKYLFIDVRRNGGGSDIVHQPIYGQIQFMAGGTQYERQWTSRGKRITLKQLLGASYVKGQKGQMWKDIIQTYWKADIITEKDSFMWEGHSGYNGTIFILQGEKTFSSAYNFCWVLRTANSDCLLVGETVGQHNPIFGNRIDLQLPNTKIPFAVATSRALYKYDLPEENGFLKPDIYYSFQRKDTVLLDELKQITRLKY